MTFWWLILILAAIGSFGIAFIWLAVLISNNTQSAKKRLDSNLEAADDDVEHIFNRNFREELKNRGRLHFEKILSENAMFLQQDLRLTTFQLNEFMKSEITRKLQEEFDKYEQSIMDAKQIAVESIQKTNQTIDEQRKLMSEQVEKQIQLEKEETMKHFEASMTDIVNHYIMAAVGNQIDLSEQLEYILGELERNKKAILEDIKSGA